MSINPRGESIDDSVDIMPGAEFASPPTEENEEYLNAILDELAEFLEEDTVEFVENYNFSFHNGERTISEGRSHAKERDIVCSDWRYCGCGSGYGGRFVFATGGAKRRGWQLR